MFHNWHTAASASARARTLSLNAAIRQVNGNPTKIVSGYVYQINDSINSDRQALYLIEIFVFQRTFFIFPGKQTCNVVKSRMRTMSIKHPPITAIFHGNSNCRNLLCKVTPSSYQSILPVEQQEASLMFNTVWGAEYFLLPFLPNQKSSHYLTA